MLVRKKDMHHELGLLAHQFASRRAEDQSASWRIEDQTPVVRCQGDDNTQAGITTIVPDRLNVDSIATEESNAHM